jgi:dGTPase
LKDITYKIEAEYLSPFAAKSENTRGRARPEEPSDTRTDYQRDRDRIIHSKSFRRLKNKTQVFLSPEGDHYRTRLTHTMEVAQIARSIARLLRLNEDLCEAIALGHDLGHTPFGHAGEKTLSRLTGGYFKHNEQSLRVVDLLENDGAGLNLTREVRDGIVNHKTGTAPATLEGYAVMFADKIAYINHDIDDALRAGVLRAEEIPENLTEILGKSSSMRINTMIMAIYSNSFGKNTVDMEKTVKAATFGLRDFLFERVYRDNEAKSEEEKADRMTELLYAYFLANPDKLPALYAKVSGGNDSVAVCDYISSMTDRYSVHIFKSIFIPASWNL